MQQISIIIDDPAARFGPIGVYLRGLGRVQPGDGEMLVRGYGFNGEDWSWHTADWYAWHHHNHPFSWGYVYDFSNGLRGVSRVNEVIPALAALGARFDPAGPSDPPARPTVSPDFREALIREMERNLRRPVADSAPPINWISPTTIRWPTLDEEGNPT